MTVALPTPAHRARLAARMAGRGPVMTLAPPTPAHRTRLVSRGRS
ncbi:hypothetical protein ACIBH1_15550 [Nonomuraea sp. NPDC050663]